MSSVGPLLSLLLVGAVLSVGVALVAVLDALAAALVSGLAIRPSLVTALTSPWRRAAFLLLQQRSRTERPDAEAWVLAPAAYLALAAAGLSVVPFGSDLAVADVPAGIVLWGTVEVLAVVAIFLHGWSANSVLPLVGGYRYVAAGLSFILVSMFVLIAAALPAESLQMSAIVESQRGLWNVVRQPLGLPLFLVVGLGVAFWGPMNLADSDDLAGGTGAEVSGPSRLVWSTARAAMLVSFAAVAATVFLGGWLGPWLPGPVWLGIKTLAVLAVLVLVGQITARFGAERFVAVAWLVLLPLSFLDLVLAGLEALP